MESYHFALIAIVIAAALGWMLTGLYARAMSATGRLEAPNERSLHKAPVPVGAGVAIVVTGVVLWPFVTHLDALLLASFAALAVVSWVDDRRALPPLVRLAAQAAAVAVCLSALSGEARVLTMLPLAVERVAIGLAWLWFINLFNFMDGIDGLAGSEAVAIAVGYAAVAGLAGLDSPLTGLALVLAAATGGYLVWNWHPASVLMGDSGSIPLGFLLGWLMIDLAVRGAWVPALILPAYFAADATITLMRRLLAGARPWQPHREHFYQRAVLGGASHAHVTLRVIAANVLLLALAMVSVTRPGLALAASSLVIAALLADLSRLAGKRLAKAK
jgi:UDP-N-acetylmuramyl pentapeptide phosphotransferase/UDP-N-acetylglucosamine-1-phosphate transferase